MSKEDINWLAGIGWGAGFMVGTIAYDDPFALALSAVMILGSVAAYLWDGPKKERGA